MCVTSVRACMREWVRGVCREADERCRGERDAVEESASLLLRIEIQHLPYEISSLLVTVSHMGTDSVLVIVMV